MVEKNKHYFYELFETKFYKTHKDDISMKNEMDKCIIESILTKDVDKTKWKNFTTAVDQQEKIAKRIEEKKKKMEENNERNC